MENSFRWCFIGTGKLAGQVAKQITSSSRHQIVSVYTRRFEKAKAFTEKYGGTPYGTAQEAISDPNVDGVYVVTPHNSHYLYARQALLLNRPVLCEKAFTTDAAQAKELIDISREKGVYIAEAMWTWFSPIANQVRKWLDDGEFGEINKLIMNYHLDVRNYAPRLTDPNLAGGALLDSGVYPITYLYRLFGKPTNISCKGIIVNGCDMEEDVEMSFENGKTYLASISIRDFKGLEKLVIRGSKASMNLRFFHAADKVTLRRNHGRSETVKGDGSYLNEFDIAAREIRNGQIESSMVPHQATLDVMEIMDECRRQMGLVYPFER